MFKAFEKPIKLHIADAYNNYDKPIGCRKPRIYNSNRESNLTIGGIWLE